MSELKPYTTTERVKLRLAHIAPGVAINDYINGLLDDPKESRRMRERVYKGNPKTLIILEKLSEIFKTHRVFWIEDDREIVEGMARDDIRPIYKRVRRSSPDVGAGS